MRKAIHLLLVEDSDDDAKMIVRTLERAGFDVRHQRVESASALAAALADPSWEAVISDYNMPGFSGLDALRIVRAAGLHVPFILVSGTAGEEIAVDALKAGADDYVLKKNLSRLPNVLERVLKEAAVRAEHRKVEHELQRFRATMDALPDAIYLTDPVSMRFIYVNDAACKRLGYSREEMLQKGPRDVLATGEEQIKSEFEALLGAGERGISHEHRVSGTGDTPRWVELNRRALQTAEGTVVISIGRDITERKQAEEKIERLNRVHALLSGVNSLIVRVRDRDELFREACRLAVRAGGFRMAWLGIIDREAKKVLPVAWEGTGADYINRMPMHISAAGVAGIGLSAQAVAERRAIVVDDMALDPRVTLKEEARERGFRSLIQLPLLVDEEAVGVLALYSGEVRFFDVEEMKLLSELAGDIAFALDSIAKRNRLDYLVFYDHLTGLANRPLFLERLAQSIRAVGPAGGKFALALLDIERLRTVNESLGRQAGDELLKQVAARLAAVGGPSAVGRIGADHFALMQGQVKGRSEATRALAAALNGGFIEPFSVDGQEVRLAAKAGAALFPADGADAETLLGNAEAALRKAKQLGERQMFFSADLTELTTRSLTLETKLRQALEKEEFILHYQPKVDVETRRILGVEALIRWQSPELGLVPPLKFIPLMEETGLILEVGTWALRQAVRDHALWLGQGLAAPRIAVNVSAIQLRRKEFLATVREALARGATPTGIDLEITESLVMQDIHENIAKLRAIRELGVEIAIDDFGTGYSSLAYLAKLPVHALKIDRSFIITMLAEPDTMTLVSTMISLAHSLRLKVVAEGVDEQEQAKMLRLLRCDQMQGFLVSRPVPFEAMTGLLKQPT